MMSCRNREYSKAATFPPSTLATVLSNTFGVIVTLTISSTGGLARKASKLTAHSCHVYARKRHHPTEETALVDSRCSQGARRQE